MKIGSLCLRNNLLMAPMAGITDLPFRLAVRKCGCGLAFTEMISAHGLVRSQRAASRCLASSEEDRPLGVQIFGSDPSMLAEAARMLTGMNADLIDLNMGCPAKKVVRGGSGAAIMRSHDKVAAVVRAVRAATPLPVTVKLRAGWKTGTDALAVGRIVQDCGADAVILHPRTADQGFSGNADWSLIEILKKNLAIPVVGNGDIRQPQDGIRMLVETGCDGIMIGRGALGNPWIFSRILSLQEGSDRTMPPEPSSEERMLVIQRHLDMEVAYHGEERSVINFRKHLLWYTKGLSGGALFRQRAGQFTRRDEVLTELQAFFRNSGTAG
ncbi:MAG: tRNA dihydrouridine synthase DusB [Syntrophales bacterium]|jgi:nifR3 family TIM-barrel protein|nr:tRNA dihydrouridine synthase DusB [Syntrophales bacterium]